MVLGSVERFFWLAVAGGASFLALGKWGAINSAVRTGLVKFVFLIIVLSLLAAVVMFIMAKLEDPTIKPSSFKMVLIPIGVIVGSVVLLLMLGAL